MKKELKIRFKANRPASALIMTMVLTVLLAIVAVMFVAVARMDRASTSNIADNKTLDLAAKSIVEIINNKLINDVPGAGQEYYDYPDANNAWLASIEPYKSGTNYYWRQISDATGYLARRNFDCNDVDVQPYGIPSSPDVIHDNPIYLDPNSRLRRQSADADGDGIADSWWIELEDTNWSMRSSKGRRIYAAIRVIDNGGMVNINTAHTFNPGSTDITKIDGSTQMQINLKGLLKGTSAQINAQMKDFNEARCGSASGYWPNYERNVIWNYKNVPDGNYLPFDISDELELKYRYCIDSNFQSRFEYKLPNTARGAGSRNSGNLYNTDSGWGLHDWKTRITDPIFPNDPDADRRHMLTAYNLDRIIEPNGVRMTNINVADINTLYNKIHAVIPDADTAAQIAVNIIDYRDNDSDVTVFNNPDNSKNYYGFETPCVYISELVYRQVTDINTSTTYKSYAIELFKPYAADIDPNFTWQIVIDSPSATVPISSWTGSKQYYVIKWEVPQAPLNVDTSNADTQDVPFVDGILTANSTISLTRKVGSRDIVVDAVVVPVDWSSVPNGDYSVPRDINNPNKCIRRLWASADTYPPMLGRDNGPIFWEMPATSYRIQAHPANGAFTNIGQIGMIFRKAAYYELGGSNIGVIGYNSVNQSEPEVRLNLADPNYRGLFNYLTIWPRPGYALGSNEKIKGRININTAPAYVLAQLPWVSLRRNNYNDPNLARAIVAYRDKFGSDANCNYSGRASAAGFENIGQLMNVRDPAVNRQNYSIDYYARDFDAGNPVDQNSFPDLTFNDGAPNDFEERDLIFARISDLVTVRSDVFTAYILVRVCTSIEDVVISGVPTKLVKGPQKRYMVIFDRSETTPANRRVRIIAFHSVPEAR